MSNPSKRSLFGTDGIRGAVNVFPMTSDIALRLGQAVAHISRELRNERQKVLIGKDTRLSGYMFEDALASGICSMGTDVIQAGPVPTPALPLLIRDLHCDAGAMISASHNPYSDNGIKFFGSDGFKLPDEIEAKMEELIVSGELDNHQSDSNVVGRVRHIEDAASRYVAFLKKTFSKDFSLEDFTIVLDCANGAGYKVGPEVLKELGAKVYAIEDRPDGRNINKDCGSLHPEKVIQKVKELGADLGIALDGDADRCLIVSGDGDLIDGDSLLAMFARDYVARDVLQGDAIVATVMSNLGLERVVNSIGIKLVRTQVGDRYVVERMRDLGCNLGGEQSGHVIFLDRNTTGDGLATALQVLDIMRRTDSSVSELQSGIERYPQFLVSVRVQERRPLTEIDGFVERLRQVEVALGDQGRVLVRYSGTEPKVRVMVEGDDQIRVREYAEDLATELRRTVGLGLNP